MKKAKNVLRGKKSKAAGTRFELKVRKDYESKGWIVDKWSNNVDLDKDKLVPAKNKFNPFSKAMMLGGGFPDFICFRKTYCSVCYKKGIKKCDLYEVIGVEAKSRKYLDVEEKKKAKWLLENNIFSRILIASRGEKRGIIEYNEFKA